MKKILIILLLFVGCKAKHTTTTITQTDTIFKSKIVKVQPSQLNEIVIDDICDSLGNVRPFSYVLLSDDAKVSLQATKTGLKASINLDSIKQVWESEYKSHTYIKEVEVEKPVRYLPWWVKYLKWLFITSLAGHLWTFRTPLISIIKKLL